MSSLKDYLQSIRHYSLPKTRALQQELETVHEEQAVAAADHAVHVHLVRVMVQVDQLCAPAAPRHRR